MGIGVTSLVVVTLAVVLGIAIRLDRARLAHSFLASPLLRKVAVSLAVAGAALTVVDLVARLPASNTSADIGRAVAVVALAAAIAGVSALGGRDASPPK